MNYNEALEYIHGVCWMGSRLGLERTYELMHKLGDPQKDLKFIHIAGTNGKGSIAAMLASVLTRAGYRTGLYTSPYIDQFTERFQIDGEQISKEELAEITEQIRPFADAMEDHPTEFELVTAIGLQFFHRNKCDIVVFEVGMGGALDSTNIIDTPEAAVIAAMGLDHTRELGDTIEQIAQAKAGIIKPGGDVVIYGNEPAANKVFQETCREKGATLYLAAQETVVRKESDLAGQTFDVGQRRDLFLPLLGACQPNNCATALKALDVLRAKGWNISEEAIRQGLRETSWPGRFQVMRRNPVFVVDGAHNPHGIQDAKAGLMKYFPGRKIHFLIGVMADKDVSHILEALTPIAASFVAVRPNNPRAMAADELRDRILAFGAEATACQTVQEGGEKVIEQCGKDGIGCALGSLYMSSDVRACFNQYHQI